MVTWSYMLASGQIRFGGACDPEVNPLTEGKLTLLENPDPFLHRINRPGLPGYSETPTDGVPHCGVDMGGIAFVRKATSAELSAATDAEVTQRAADRADDLAVRGLAAFILQELNVIRAALPVPLPALQVTAARTFVVNFVKSRL